MRASESLVSSGRWFACLLLLAFFILPHPIAPAVITVDGGCSLVDAVTAANTDTAVGGCPAGSGDDDVVLTADVVLTQVDNETDGANGLPSVTSDLTVLGNGFAIRRADGTPRFRIFDIALNSTVSFNSLTLTNGGQDYHYGAGGPGGGAIRNLGHLTMTGSTVADSYAYTSGGISSSGTLILVDSTVSENFAYFTAGVGATGVLTVTDSQVTDNSAFFEDGGITSGAVATLTNTTVSGNFAFFGGGGIFNWGSLTIDSSTVSGNNASYGDGIWNYGTLDIVNSTFSGNQILGRSGTGTASNSTFWGSTIVWYELFTLTNSALGNSGCGGVVDGGNNFDEDGICGELLTGLDPVLADNGGPTLTHALLEGSSRHRRGGRMWPGD